MRKFSIALLIALGLAAPAAAQHIITPNGWYSVACPNGEYATLEIQKGLKTNTGPVALPGNQNVLYIDHACDGSGRFAGVGNVDDKAYEHSVGGWLMKGTAFAINPIVYQNGGVIVIVSGPGPTGSQGWRYNSDQNTLVSGDSTYANPALHIWEYTGRNDVTCGQGADADPGTEGGGLQCLVAGRRVLVWKGIVRAVRFKWSGDIYAFGFVRQDRKEGHLLWMTRAQLNALPTYSYAVGPVDPPIDPPVEEPPVQNPALPANVCAILKEERNKYGTITEALQISKILNNTAWRANGNTSAGDWGLSTKKGGTKCPSPGAATGTDIACDILHRKSDNYIWDVLGAAGVGEPTTAGCGDAIGTMEDGSRPWVRASDPGGPIDPPVDPKDKIISDLRAQVVSLQAEIEALRASNDERYARIGQLESQLEAVQKELNELKAAPAPTYRCEAKVPGFLRALGIRVGCQIVQN